MFKAASDLEWVVVLLLSKVEARCVNWITVVVPYEQPCIYSGRFSTSSFIVRERF